MNKTKQKLQRQKRTRAKISGMQSRPRLSVSRSNKYMFVQLIDDQSGKTLLALSEVSLKETKGTKIERAKALGAFVAKLAQEKKIKKVVFDRGSYRYHGRVKAVAEGIREGGLQI